MAVTRSGVLGRAHTVAGTTVYTLFTVPIGETAIVKDVAIQNQSAGPIHLALWLQTPGDTIEGVIYDQVLASRGILHWQGWEAAGPGEQCVLSVDTGQDLHVWVSGALLPGHI